MCHFHIPPRLAYSSDEQALIMNFHPDVDLHPVITVHTQFHLSRSCSAADFSSFSPFPVLSNSNWEYKDAKKLDFGSGPAVWMQVKTIESNRTCNHLNLQTQNHAPFLAPQPWKMYTIEARLDILLLSTLAQLG